MATKKKSPRRAIGVVRVSRVRGREGEGFVSPEDQTRRIEEACKRDGIELLRPVLRELEVSGGAPLEKRPGLREAVERIEAGEADVIVVAFFDRLVRSVTVQAEVAERVERAGGGILALDVGEVRSDTASRWLTSGMLGIIAEYQRRQTIERTAEAKARAVARGEPPFPRIPPGYRKRHDGSLEPDKHAVAVRRAFEMRAEGASLSTIRGYLAKRGVKRASIAGLQQMLANRVYRGELHFGELENLKSHLPIVDEATFDRVQRMKIPRGRRAKSERLLARLGVLRCASCGSRLVVSSRTVRGRTEVVYRCPTGNDCTGRVSMSAGLAEETVVEAVKTLLRGVEGSASVGGNMEAAERDLDVAEAQLVAAVEAFTGLEDVAAARQRLLELREARDEARDRLDELHAAQMPAVTVTADDWDRLAFDERRALIRAIVERADVAKGSGPERIKVTPR